MDSIQLDGATTVMLQREYTRRLMLHSSDVVSSGNGG